MRRRAESGSPCEPVETTTTLWSGQSSTSWGWMRIPSGSSMWPSERPMLTFLRIERPTRATLRPSAAAVLVELGPGHGHGQAPAVDGRPVGQLTQDPRQGAEMILVSVRDDDRVDVGRALAQVGEVGEHEVDAEHVSGREAQADVDHD